MLEWLRQAVAAAVLAAFGLALASPLALAFGPENGEICSRGRCCCPGAPTAGGPCVRATCGCGGDRQALVTAPSLDEGLLPAPVTVGGDDDTHALSAPDRSLPLTPDLLPPDHPPPFSLSTTPTVRA